MQELYRVGFLCKKVVGEIKRPFFSLTFSSGYMQGEKMFSLKEDLFNKFLGEL